MKTGAVRARAPFLLAWLAVWLAQVLPAIVIADETLDPSWSRALGRFLAERLAIGEDYVFTYGPLGYFSTSIYEPALYWHKLVLWEVGWRLVASWFLVRALWDQRSRVARGVALALLVAIPMIFDAFAFSVIVAVASVLSGERRVGTSVRALGFLVLGSLALVKFTFAIAAGASALALIAGSLSSAGRRAALIDAACAFGSLLVCWFAAGQGLANFWPWLVNSLRIAAGYNEGESKPAGTFSTVIGLATLACSLALIAQACHARRKALGTALALCCFLSFKAGYVRGDDHTTYYLGFALLAGWLVPPSARLQRVREGIALCIAALALWGILGAPEQEGASPLRLLRDYAARLPQNARAVFLPWSFRAEREAVLASVAARLDRPRIRARVGRDPVDVFNFHQGLALLNGLEYRPRPLFQSYVAFTPELQELDVRFYEGPHAPRWVLFKLETIDDRLPTMEHARLLETFLRWYAPVLCEKRELLLERRTTPLPPARRTTEVERELAYGEELALPATSAPARLLTLDLRTNALGHLAQFLYRAPEIELESTDEFGNRRRQRVIPGMMRTGVLIDPVVSAGDGWVQFLVGARQPRLRSLRVVLPPGWEWMYEQRFGLKLERAEGFAPPPDEALSRSLNAFVFERMPDGVQVERQQLRLDYAGRDCLFVFAPSTLGWRVPAGKHSLSTIFGMVLDPRHLPASTRATFQVGLVEGAQQKLLFERTLDLSKPADQGLLKLDLPFECAGEAQLILRTTLPPEDRTKNAWCLWSEVTLR